jgi:hypothetical protein
MLQCGSNYWLRQPPRKGYYITTDSFACIRLVSRTDAHYPLLTVPSVQERGPFCPFILSDVSNKYEQTWYAYKCESGSKDPTEFVRLCDRLSALRAKIDGLLREEGLNGLLSWKSRQDLYRL